MLMRWASDFEPSADDDVYDTRPQGLHLHRMYEDGEALAICFCCGDPICTDAGDYAEWFEFERLDECPDPDPHWVTLCEGCSCAFEMGCDVDEFYYEDAA